MEKKTSRTNMKAEDRRNQILDCAQSLIFQKGYDNATITDIMNAAGVSKGGFYHHFASKEEVLVSILERMVFDAQAALLPAIETENLSALQRYELYFSILRGQQSADALDSVIPVIVALFHDANAGLQLRLTNSLTEAVLPIFARVLQCGIDDGIFKIDDAFTAARLIIQIGNHHQVCLKPALDAANEEELELAGRRLVACLRMQGLATDRLLGIPDGSTAFRSADFADRFISLLMADKFPPLAAGEKQ